jgi:nucleotide-binding universal stress UspA family protein
MNTMSGKYLVCADKSEISKVAVRFASMKAKKTGGVVEILHVVEPVTMQTLFAVSDKIKEEKRAESWDTLQKLADIAQTISGVRPNLLVKEGSIGEEILTTIMSDSAINLLILAASPERSGKGKLSHWLAGKLGEKLLVPILLVPGSLTDQQIETLA